MSQKLCCEILYIIEFMVKSCHTHTQTLIQSVHTITQHIDSWGQIRSALFGGWLSPLACGYCTTRQTIGNRMSSSISNSIIKQIGLSANKYSDIHTSSHTQLHIFINIYVYVQGWIAVCVETGRNTRGNIKREIHSSTLELCPVALVK